MELIEWFFGIIFVLLSVFLAHYLGTQRGIEQGRQLREEEKEEEKKELIASLLSEIEHNETQLNIGIEPRARGFPHKAFWRPLFTDNFNSAKSSERYLSLSQKAQKTMSEYYKGVERMKTLVNKLDGEEVARTISGIYSEQVRLLIDLKKNTENLKKILKNE